MKRPGYTRKQIEDWHKLTRLADEAINRRNARAYRRILKAAAAFGGMLADAEARQRRAA